MAVAKAARPVQLSPYLFCTLKGKCYFKDNGRAGSWESLWRNFMAKVMDETKVTEHFTEHDLRTKCASDTVIPEHVCSLLAHADSKLTDRVYRRRPEVVNPLR